MGVRGAFLGGLVVLSLVGCNPMSTAEAQAQFCKNLFEFRSAVSTLTKTDASTSVGQLKDAQKRVQQEMVDLQKSAQALRNTKVDDLQKAYTDLDRAISGLPSDATIGQAVTMITPQVRAVETAWNQMGTTARCI